jgi:RNA polymerase primary sigma factor
MIINSRKDTSTNIYYVNRNNSIDRYLNSIREFKPLTFEQENEYITKYKVDGDMKARDMLINCNQRFVYSAAKRFTNNANTVLELVNEGNIGLIEAIDKFDFTKGCRFLTFAKEYIRRNMVNYYCENRLVKRPSDTKIGSRVATERSIFYNLNQRHPTTEELRSIMLNKYGLKISNDSDLEIPDYIYIDENVSENDDNIDKYRYENAPEFVCVTSSNNDYIKQSEADDTKAVVLAALSKLDQRSADIVKMIYGIDLPREYSVSEIADMYNMTTTRIHQIKREAAKKLQYLITA